MIRDLCVPPVDRFDVLPGRDPGVGVPKPTATAITRWSPFAVEAVCRYLATLPDSPEVFVFSGRARVTPGVSWPLRRFKAPGQMIRNGSD